MTQPPGHRRPSGKGIAGYRMGDPEGPILRDPVPDPVLTEEQEMRIVEALAVAFPDAPRDEIRRRVESHNRAPDVICRQYLSPLVHGELMLLRLRHTRTKRRAQGS